MELKKYKVPCEIYTRVSGFYRPLRSFNSGKKEEFRQRRMYKISHGNLGINNDLPTLRN